MFGQLSLIGRRSSPPVTPGSQTLTSSGNFVVPAYNTLIVELFGGGGQGATSTEDTSTFKPSNDTIFVELIAGGGWNGAGAKSASSVGGVGGVASGGDVNTPGEAGGDGSSTSQRANAYGGACPNGGGRATVGQPAKAPGGGGYGAYHDYFNGTGSGGGGGSYLKKTYRAGQLQIGRSIPVTVSGPSNNGNGAGGGARGEARFTWS